jgi:putative FmdB family regulatory protein
MPTYEYSCEKCQHQFEVYQSMTEAPLTVCPKEKCALGKWGRGRVKRLIGAGAGLIFKGSGFYITDYRSEGYKAEAKKETQSKPATSSDGKPAPAPDSKPSTAKTDSKPASPTPAKN